MALEEAKEEGQSQVEGASPPQQRYVAPLASLATRIVAHQSAVEEIVAYLEFLPLSIRSELFTHLSSDRLRQVEVTWQQHNKSDSAWPFEHETQHVWYQRCMHQIPRNNGQQQQMKRNYRRVFWEHQCRLIIRRQATVETEEQPDKEEETEKLDTVDSDINNSSSRNGNSDKLPVELPLFQDLVQELKVHGREMVATTAELLLRLKCLRRLEVHHPEQQKTCWSSLTRVIQHYPTMRELCFFHGKLPDHRIEQIRDALLKRAKLSSNISLTTLEIVSMKLSPRAHSQLVALVRDVPNLKELRITNSITDLDNHKLLTVVYHSRSLKTLCLEHNDLEDDTFCGLLTHHSSIALRHLKLGHNALSVSTLRNICGASLNGYLNRLNVLDLNNNVDIGDDGIYALTPMLASPATTLTVLDLSNCSIGLEGVMNLLLALGKNQTLTHLNLSYNFFGVGVGDFLADFLLTNTTLTSLYLNYVGLSVTETTRLLVALEQNSSLMKLSLGANRLRDEGATLIFAALVKRSRQKPFELVDLSGNLLTIHSLTAIASSLQDDVDNDVSEQVRIKRQRLEEDCYHHQDQQCRRELIGELHLLNNDFAIKEDSQNNSAMNSRNAFTTIRKFVGQLHTNEWSNQRNVYDDEV